MISYRINNMGLIVTSENGNVTFYTRYIGGHMEKLDLVGKANGVKILEIHSEKTATLYTPTETIFGDINTLTPLFEAA